MLPGTYREDDAIGVRYDTILEGRLEVRNAISQLSEMNVMLDSLADDDEGIWTDDERTELRQMQETMQALIESKGDDLEDISDEIDAVTEEMGE